MCVALILLMNSFYKVYYSLFDLCEHAIVSVLLLTTVLLFFLPILVGISTDEQRPLFTIAVLVSGVVGGLAVVITVVYLYRFCLKKRSPVTTTWKPELKREQIRSQLQSLSRPLPLINEVSNEQFSVNSKITSDDKETSVFGSPTKIAQVFPLLSKESSYVQRSVPDSISTEFKNAQVAQLSEVQSSVRPVSSDFLRIAEPPEIRRASYDVPRGTGRMLPSTEGLEVSP